MVAADRIAKVKNGFSAPKVSSSIPRPRADHASKLGEAHSPKVSAFQLRPGNPVDQ